MNNLTISLFIYLIFIPTFIRLFGDRGIEKSREKENLCLSRSFNFVAQRGSSFSKGSRPRDRQQRASMFPAFLSKHFSPAKMDKFPFRRRRCIYIILCVRRNKSSTQSTSSFFRNAGFRGGKRRGGCWAGYRCIAGPLILSRLANLN